MTPHLAPCPFCRPGAPLPRERTTGAQRLIACSECGAEGPVVDLRERIEAWTGGSITKDQLKGAA